MIGHGLLEISNALHWEGLPSTCGIRFFFLCQYQQTFVTAAGLKGLPDCGFSWRPTISTLYSVKCVKELNFFFKPLASSNSKLLLLVGRGEMRSHKDFFSIF